jgi:hypothetical protein
MRAVTHWCLLSVVKKPYAAAGRVGTGYIPRYQYYDKSVFARVGLADLDRRGDGLP